MPTGTPPRLARALAALDAQRDAGVHFAPIRHHSPGCATALAALLAEVGPSAVLIEGPLEFTALLPALADERTRPPIAALSLSETGSGFYPLAEFSPEWVALRWGSTNDAEVVFIDQPWSRQLRDEAAAAATRTMQAEQHLAHSESIARLAQQLGCRDHDEVWEHLFEARHPDRLSQWRGYFADVLAWAGMARLDYHRDLLDADGTHAREAVMSAMIARHRDRGPIVVVTGAFHTMALLEVLTGADEGAWVSAQPAPLDADDPAWLIRYDHTRLDGLRGYGAGMPAPGFWQQAWQARREGLDPAAFSTQVLLTVAERLRSAKNLLSTSQVEAAAVQALRLAELRGRSWPGRTDLLDAMLSCFVQDDGGFSGPLAEAVSACFGGTAMGELPPGLAAPPLVAEVRSEASRLNFTISDSTKRRVRLDTARKPAHVQRREFLARLQFLGVGFAAQIGGANLVAGTGAGLLFEEWEYAWTPMTEAALIEIGLSSATLHVALTSRLHTVLGEQGRSSAAVAATITEIVAMGLTEELSGALHLLRACYDSDPSLASITASLHRLGDLAEATGRLSVGEHGSEVIALMESGLAAAAYQLTTLAGVDTATVPEVCSAVVNLHALLRRLNPDVATGSAVRRELATLRSSGTVAPQLLGVLIGLAANDGEIDADQLAAAVSAHLSPGADPEQLAGFLLGVMEAAPGLILHQPELLESVNQAFAALSEPAFLQVLPDLRKAFTWLKPAETHHLARLVAHLVGADAGDLDTVLSVDPALVAHGQAVERELLLSLERDGLGDWGRP